MDRAAAVRLIRKLQTLADPARGGTPNEREVAATKAAGLMRRFGISAAESQPMPEVVGSGYGRRSGSASFVAPIFGAAWVWGDWEFNVYTGAASSNVKVHHHHNAGNWKIEIFPRPRRDLPGMQRDLPEVGA